MFEHFVLRVRGVSIQWFAFAVGCSIALSVGYGQELTREQKVRQDKQRVEAEGFWLYNDLDAAYTQARETGKPILVVLRCLPCEECVKLDDDLVDNDPELRELLEQYVCVRIVGTNGLDLDTFQYDTDQSFAVFMLNADKTIYGRFGTRSHRTDWVGDVSLQGMAAALRGGLELHSQYPANASSLAGKRGQPLEFSSPEKFPTLKKKYTDQLNYSGDVVGSCIHCHQIGEARREFYWLKGEPIPEKLLFSYPHPKSLGLILDPRYRGRVKAVQADSPAASCGLKAGDDIAAINGQPILSMADVQWVLHNAAPDGEELKLEVQRDGAGLVLSMRLEAGWRERDDLSWRVTSWTMGRISLGGMRLVELDDQERGELKIQTPMALRVRSVGRYGPHATAMKQGFEKDDIVLSFDGRDDLLRESDIFKHVNENRKPGQRVEVQILRGGKRMNLQLPIQE